MTPWLSRVVLRLVRRDIAEFIAGDLEEEYTTRVARDGRSAARRWYVSQAVRAVVFVPRRMATRAAHDAPTRAPKGDGFVGTLFSDLRHGVRLLFKTPGYTAVVIVTLALAIGANSVIFSFANVLLIKPLPIKDPDSLGWIYALDPQRATMRGRTSYPDFDDLRRASRSFVTLSASTTDNVTMSGRGEPQRLLAQKVSPSLFDTWGLKLVLGRALAPAEDVAGAPCAVVLSHKLWKAQFHSDAGVLAQTLTIDGRPCAVAGVMDPSIEFGNLSLTDVWMPLAVDPGQARRDDRRYSMVGRLRPGVTHEQADAEIKTIMARLGAEHPDTNRNWSARVAPTKEAIAGGDTWVVLALLGLVVGLVLMIACANLANLALARTAGRRRELAVRAALGATRWRTVRQLVTESLMLGAAGGLAGLAVAEAGLRIMRAAAYEQFFALIIVDRNVMLFGAALSVLSPILFTLLPALHASDNTGEALKEGGRSAGGVRARRSRHALVVAQVSLALTLLIVSTLVVRSMIVMNNSDLGFDPSPLLVARLEVPKWKHADAASVVRVQEEILGRIRRLPGVEAGAASNALPVLSQGSRTAFDIAGRATSSAADRPWALQVSASDDYFRTVGIPVLTGRAFETVDRADAEPVAIVSAEAARRYWGSPAAALGARVAPVASSAGDQPVWRRVIGVVADIKSEANPDLVAAVEPQFYVPLAQRPSPELGLVVRSSRIADLPGAIRAAVREADADMPVFQIRSMTEAIHEELASSWIITGMFVAFAILALVLASTGLYAVVAYSVGQRTQEIGVRIALGALPSDIPRLVFSQGIRLVGMGGALGLLGAFLVSQAVRSVFYGVSPTDPLTYGGVVAAVILSSLLAMWLPARRAARVDPVTSLRGE